MSEMVFNERLFEILCRINVNNINLSYITLYTILSAGRFHLGNHRDLISMYQATLIIANLLCTYQIPCL